MSIISSSLAVLSELTAQSHAQILGFDRNLFTMGSPSLDIGVGWELFYDQVVTRPLTFGPSFLNFDQLLQNGGSGIEL